jgi:hypothetical protein
LATLVGVITNWIQSLVLRCWAQEKAEFSAPRNADDRRELMQLSMKSLPNVIFFCFQGQVTLLILTLFGNPGDIADITALGRLAALFAVLLTTFATVLTPRFMRCQDPVRLPRLYLLLVGSMVLVLLPLAALSWFVPGPLLWLLGNKYAGLETECGWVVSAGCITLLGTAMWSLNSSKAWIHFQAWAYIPTVLLFQVLGLSILDLRQFNEVLRFALLTATAPLPIFIADALYGLYFDMKSRSAPTDGG